MIVNISGKVTAISHQYCTSHKTSMITGQVGNSVGNILSLTDASDRILFIVSRSRSTSSSLVTSATTGTIRPVITTLAPLLANSRAVAAPIPELEPVMRATRPVKS
ncbi:unnamed protein product [Medioppia subpectinata]|uniref:Uncharacterized protein n=1 Tax=Medioppia subpectinata TaxID=1979941 RepID=A0A7R9KVZ4_9ACAR|nr:unnamed protein product [Medioppia subpectinata]CAG2110850.1 unnamed protein product [Medioppia subpectinata]